MGEQGKKHQQKPKKVADLMDSESEKGNNGGGCPRADKCLPPEKEN